MGVEILTTCSDADIVMNSNRVRELVLDDLVEEEYISSSDRDRYLATRVLIAYRPSWFGKIWKKLQKIEPKEELILTIRAVGDDGVEEE